jgi:hypothetical protein
MQALCKIWSHASSVGSTTAEANDKEHRTRQRPFITCWTAVSKRARDALSHGLVRLRKRDLWMLQRQRKGREGRRTMNTVETVPTSLFNSNSLESMTMGNFGPIIDISCLDQAGCTSLKVEVRIGHVLAGASWANHSTQPSLLLSASCSPCLDSFVRELPAQ